jgi:sugar lactone lactonase YvrE
MAVACVCAACAAVPAQEVGGVRPTYLDSPTAEVPNLAALGRRIWTPSLDEGYVSQGLTFSGGYLYVSSYLPQPDLKSNTGPCRVFRIDAATGKPAGSFELPVGTCTHSGGLEHLGDGRLFLADTRRIFLIDVERALATGKAQGAMKSLKLAGDLRGSYATFDGKDVWIGTWTKDAKGKARMYRLDPKLFDGEDDATIDHTRALESIPVPLEAQGAVFDASGNIWVSASSGSFGLLYRLDRKGEVRARYEMVAGLEDLAFDGRTLWGLSESGTRKYLHWPTRFPFIFEIDPAKLK